MPNDLKAQTVQWVINASRSLVALPMFSTASGIDRCQFEQGLRDVEVALAEYRSAPGPTVQADFGLSPAGEIGVIALRNPRMLVPMLVLLALGVGVIILSNAQRRAHQNLDEALRRWANRLFYQARGRPVTVTDLRALDKRVQEDFASRGSRCRDPYEAYVRALSRLRQLLSSPTRGGLRGIALALSAFQAALEALYACLGMPVPRTPGVH